MTLNFFLYWFFSEEKINKTLVIGETWKYFYNSKNFSVFYIEIHCDKILEKKYLIILTTYFKNYKLLVSVYTKINFIWIMYLF